MSTRDELPDTDRLVIFGPDACGKAGLHVNGVAGPGTLVVAARGKPGVATAVDLHRDFRQDR